MPTPAAKSEDLILPSYRSLTLTALTTKTFAKSARPLKSIYRPLDQNNKARMESTGGLTNTPDRFEWLGFFPLVASLSGLCLKSSILVIPLHTLEKAYRLYTGTISSSLTDSWS